MATDVDEQSILRLLNDDGTNLNRLHQRDDPRMCDPELDNAPLSMFVNRTEAASNAAVKIPGPICEHIRDLYDDPDTSLRDLADDLDVDYKTVWKHVNGECSHDYRPLSGAQCDAIRAAAHDGVTPSEIAEVFSFARDRKYVWKHVHGGCECPAEIEPVGVDE